MSTITKRWDAVVGRKWVDKQTGEEKTSWVNVGRAVEWDGKNIEIELNALPVFPGWNGRIKLFEPKPKGEQAAKPAPAPARAAQTDIEDDTIPF